MKAHIQMLKSSGDLELDKLLYKEALTLDFMYWNDKQDKKTPQTIKMGKLYATDLVEVQKKIKDYEHNMGLMRLHV